MPSLDNITLNPMLRIAAPWYRWRQWMGECVDCYRLRHERSTEHKLIQALVGHNDVKNTMRYPHVKSRKWEKFVRPFKQLNL
jgi:integrase